MVDKAKEIRKAFKWMRIVDNRNAIAIKHSQQLMDLLLDLQPIDYATFKSMARITLAIQERYVTEHIEGLIAWGVIAINEENQVIWIGVPTKESIKEGSNDGL